MTRHAIASVSAVAAILVLTLGSGARDKDVENARKEVLAVVKMVETGESDKAIADRAAAIKKKKDVELNLRDNVLTISGEKRSEREEEKGGSRYTERSYGRFERSIPFPTEIDPERVDAVFKNGVLTVTLPKNARAQEQTRRIEVRPHGGEPSSGSH